MGSLNRFAISAFSRKYKSLAVAEELLVHKDTGQMLIKTATGDVVSFDSLSRHKMHIDDVTSRATNLGITGELFSVDLGTIELPEVMLDSVNFLDASLLLQLANAQKVLISIDLDYINLTDYETIAEYEPNVTLNINLRKTVGQTITNNPFIITDKLSVINNKVIDPKDFFPSGTDMTQYSMHLDSITVKRHTSYSDATPMRNILYGILIIIN